MNHDNIISKVARVSLFEGISKKTNKPYQTLTIHFKNGLDIQYFVDQKDLFGLNDALNTKAQLDVDE
jgi:hypothetical protein